MPVSPSRAAAFDILLRIETTDAYAPELLNSTRFAAFSHADHGLATELVMGVLRWRNVLDHLLNEFIPKPIAKLDPEVLTALRLGVYQLIFLDRIPAHAAIYESVELTRRARKTSAAGMVNAVLRKIVKPDPPLHASSAQPQWLLERWTAHFGTAAAQKISEYNQTPPSPSLYCDDSLSRTELADAGLQLGPGKLLNRSATIQSGDIYRSRAFREHRLVLQDEASQLVALLVGQGQALLDCCAAPGGKTRIIAGQNSRSQVVAMELHPRRAALVKKLVRAPNVRIIAADARAVPLGKKFDRILVDAPCSGTGTLARNPEIKWRLKPEDIFRLQNYQLQILSAAIDLVAPSGRLVYSTCSLEPEENQAVVEKVLTAHPSFQVADCRDELQRLRNSGVLAWEDLDSLLDGRYLRTLPGVHPCDGFFAAILERS